jgi:hypothetical protein
MDMGVDDMSDPAKKVKKVKEEKPLDYMRMPDHIWEKHWKEFQDTMQDIEQSLAWVGRSIARLEKHYAKK